MSAIVWVQLIVLGIFFLCLAGVYWLDPSIWSLTKVEPFTAIAKVVNPPLLSFLDALIAHRFHYSVTHRHKCPHRSGSDENSSVAKESAATPD